MKNASDLMIGMSTGAARLAIGAAALALLSLASLHILSPEFAPSFHMVSEYANGRYGWALALMFASWGLSSWALAFAIWSQVPTTAGKVGLVFLIAAGMGEAMASVFDINHPPFHDIAGYLGILSLPVAALLISAQLGRAKAWSAVRGLLLWTAHLSWISVVLLAATFALMIATYMQSGAHMDPQAQGIVRTLPAGVIGLVGYADRFLVVVYCLWVMIVAWSALKLPAR